MIGSNLVKHLVKLGHRVTVVDNLWRGSLDYLLDKTNHHVIDPERDFHPFDLAAPAQLDSLLYDVDFVCHLADVVAGVDYVFKNEWDVYQANMQINSNVLRSVFNSKIKGYLYVGTACSFPHTLQTGVNAQPLVEENLYPAWPESAYGWSKLMGIYESELMSAASNIPVANLVLHNVYGAPCDYSLEKAQVIPSLIRKAIESEGEPLVVWGSGDQGRAFIHVDDVVSAIVTALDCGWNQGIIQVGTSVCTPISEIAEKIINISGKQIELQFDLEMPEGDQGRCADWSKAKRVLDWSPKVTLDEGLRRTYNWIGSELNSAG